ncbi:hypothetical protein CONPUDRAFT_72081 [Coniophora puteana RWD-64-598 SS2]|uniref:Uncharacterized protein n=1 Tax=Coniophora puteana (strain RWD-64-598) TaxID=741705 RepID=A0A5M3MRE6_CONPW|nr:uncharacterized protein CONPUDRAFT_72081 [Coniophora puteana RWD-64-598 SS2]EIW81656.1 hypothetical protein CONPUDRAFT_72081 [Coniophora puteana RWD-64-598 SS2]
MKAWCCNNLGIYPFPVITNETIQNTVAPSNQDIVNQLTQMLERFEVHMSALEAGQAVPASGGAEGVWVLSGGVAGEGPKGIKMSKGVKGVIVDVDVDKATQDHMELKIGQYEEHAEDICKRPKDMKETATRVACKDLIVAVDDPQTTIVLQAISQSIWDNFSDADNIPVSLKNRKVKWDKLSTAKVSFRGFRHEWTKQNNFNIASRDAALAQRTRHYSHHVELTGWAVLESRQPHEDGG